MSALQRDTSPLVEDDLGISQTSETRNGVYGGDVAIRTSSQMPLKVRLHSVFNGLSAKAVKVIVFVFVYYMYM